MRMPTVGWRTLDARVLAAALLVGVFFFDLVLIAGPVTVGVVTAVAVLTTIVVRDRAVARSRIVIAELAARVEAETARAEVAEQRAEVAGLRADRRAADGLELLGAGLVRVRHEIGANRTRLRATGGRWAVGEDGLADAQWRAFRSTLAASSLTDAALYTAVAGAYDEAYRLRRANATRALVPGSPPVAPGALAVAGVAHDRACAVLDGLLSEVVRSFGTADPPPLLVVDTAQHGPVGAYPAAELSPRG